jgi:hypothetical protein
MRIRMTVPFLAALSACLNLSPVSEESGAKLDIRDNQYVDNSQVPLEDLLWIYAGADVGADGIRADATVAVFPNAFARVEFGGQNQLQHVTAGPDEVRQLSSSLARRYGDDALPAQLNRLRAAALDSGEAAAWGETTYRLDGNPLGLDARATVGGFGAEATANARLGLVGNDLEARWVRSLADASAPVDLSIPATLAEAGQRMKAGECISLRGTGTVGFNFGVGSRLLFELPEGLDADQHTVGAIADAALRVAVDSNRVDMQFCMLEGGQAVIEAGVAQATETSAALAVAAGYGVHGLMTPSIRLGDSEVDARTVLDRALRTQLHRQFGKVFSAGAEAGQLDDVRESLVRLNVDTQTRDPKILAAVAEFFQGDLRLAQELARRQTAGIRTDLEVTRQGEVSWAGAGVSIFGLSLFAAGSDSEAEFSMTNPGGSISGFATREERAHGFIDSKAGYSRTVLAGVETPRAGVADSETGLYMSWRDIDGQMERNKLNLNTHGLLAQVVGAAAFSPIAAELNAVADYVQSTCGRNVREDDMTWRRRLENCQYGVQSSEVVTDRIAQAQSLFDAASSAAGTEGTEATVARQAMALAIAAAKAYEFPALWTGAPGATIQSQAWLSEDALSTILAHTGTEFARTLRAIDPKADDGDLEDIAASFDRGRAYYNSLNAIAEEIVPNAGQVGYDTLVIRISKRNGRFDIENMVVTTLAKWRGDVLATMVDDLLDEIGDIRFWNDRKARTFTYTMLALSGSDLRDYRFDFQMRLGGDDDHYRAAGYVDTREDAIDQLDGIDDDFVGVSHRGSNVHHFGEAVGWTVNQMARLADVAN